MKGTTLADSFGASSPYASTSPSCLTSTSTSNHKSQQKDADVDFGGRRDDYGDSSDDDEEPEDTREDMVFEECEEEQVNSGPNILGEHQKANYDTGEVGIFLIAMFYTAARQ